MPRSHCLKRKSSAVSEIVATLLMVAIVVTIGTTAFAIATSGFNNFSNDVSQALGLASNQLSDEMVIEQTTFSTSGNLGANLYVRNDGVNPITITSVYVQNANSSAIIANEQFGSSSQIVINSGDFAIVSVPFAPLVGETYSFTVVASDGTSITTFATLS